MNVRLIGNTILISIMLALLILDYIFDFLNMETIIALGWISFIIEIIIPILILENKSLTECKVYPLEIKGRNGKCHKLSFNLLNKIKYKNRLKEDILINLYFRLIGFFCIFILLLLIT